MRTRHRPRAPRCPECLRPAKWTGLRLVIDHATGCTLAGEPKEAS